MRILQIIPTLVRGGAEKQLTLLATGLPRPEFDTHVCVLTHTGPYEETLRDADVPVVPIHKRWKLDPLAYARLVKLIRHLQPDIVHTWIFAANAYGRQAARQAGTRIIIGGERCVDPWKQSYEFVIDRYLAKRSTCIVTNSSGVQEFYARHGIPAEKFVVIANGAVPLERATGERSAFLQELNLPAGSRLVLAIGRLWPQKRYKDLIWAMDLIKCVRDDTHLLIAGDGPERERLTRYRDQLQIPDRVHFLGERTDIPRLLTHADCFWLGSDYEGQSNAMLEAMSLGVPVVATDIPGNRDLVVSGTSGQLVPVGDRAEFARCTIEILDNPDRAGSLGAAARQRIVQEFSVEKMVARHASLYRELKSRKG